jgi:hypothetical protein
MHAVELETLRCGLHKLDHDWCKPITLQVDAAACKGAESKSRGSIARYLYFLCEGVSCEVGADRVSLGFRR